MEHDRLGFQLLSPFNRALGIFHRPLPFFFVGRGEGENITACFLLGNGLRQREKIMQTDYQNPPPFQ